MSRTFAVWTVSTHETKVVTAHYVTDINDDEHERWQDHRQSLTGVSAVRAGQQEDNRPRVATFPVSPLYDAESQFKRAKMLSDYLNKVQAATELAMSQNALVDLLTAVPPTQP